MVAERLEKEVIQIFEHIDDNKNFLLSGGAGSGKTYSLVSVINEIYNRNPIAKIACITYTNAAVHEIENRVLNKKIRISTIHDFLWDNISPFQNEFLFQIVEQGSINIYFIRDDGTRYSLSNGTTGYFLGTWISFIPGAATFTLKRLNL